MIKCIKRFFDSRKGINFSTDWETMDLDEKLSLFAGLVEENELNRILSIIEKTKEITTDSIKNIQVFEANDGLITFQNGSHQLIFFRSVDSDL